MPLAPFEFYHSLLSLLLQHLPQGSTNVPALQAEVTRAQEAASATEVARIMMVHATETAAQEAAMA
jgi:hypothetical protein